MTSKRHCPNSRSEPPAEANPLAARLRHRIATSGPLSVEEYMRTCLTDAEHGYYRRAAVFGARGDFITAPEISQIFGELIGLWAAVTWQMMGSPVRFELVELGPGRGTMIADAFRATKVVPGFREALTLNLIDMEGPLQAERGDRLTNQGMVHRTFPSLEAFVETRVADPNPVIVLANEFIDALAVRQYIHRAHRCYERLVGVDEEGRFRFEVSEQVADVDVSSLPDLADGDIIEICTGLDEVLITPLRMLAADAPLAALFVDYGHVASMPGDTLQAVRAHQLVDLFSDPGECDLTCHVDFARVKQLAGRPSSRFANLAVDGPVPQAVFLGALGIVERASRLMAANPGKAGAIEMGVQRLMSPGGMGSRFKVIALRSPSLPPLPGFPIQHEEQADHG